MTFNEAIDTSTLSFILKDEANNAVAASLSYDAVTKTATLTPTSALAFGTTYTATVSASDTVGNAMQATTWSFTTASPAINATLFTTTDIPAVASANDTGSLELGFRFFSEVSGFINGIRFYKGIGNTGTHIGNLWSNTGTLLATATFTDESAEGWQTVMFATSRRDCREHAVHRIVLRTERRVRVHIGWILRIRCGLRLPACSR